MKYDYTLPFSELFVINVPRCVDRWESARSQLERVRAENVTRWEGIDGKRIDDEMIGHLQSEGILARDLSRFSETALTGEIGCALSHAEVLKHIIKEQIPRALILEDDFEIPKPVDEWPRRVQEAYGDLNSDWDIWFLFRCFDVRRRAKRISDRTVIPFTPLCATAYCVTPRGAEKLLHAAKPIGKAIDCIYVEDVIRKGKAKVFAASPPLVYPGGHLSIINDENLEKKWVEDGVNRPPEYWPDHFKEARGPFPWLRLGITLGVALGLALAFLIWRTLS